MPADDLPADEPRTPLILSYARLCRLPNVFTAFADIALGFCFTHAFPGLEFPPDLAPTFIALLCASGLLYTAGMVLNDVYDVQIDAVERPRRPLPAGEIPVRLAHGLGLAMLLSGCGLGWLAAMLSGQLRAGLTATALAALVFAYDRILKQTFLGPVAMGGCRMLNVLLGMSAAVEPWGASHLLVAGGLGVYIMGVTWFARQEAEESNPLSLMLASVVLGSGLCLLAFYPTFHEGIVRSKLQGWYVMLAFLAFFIGRRVMAAIVDPLPENVQLAVKSCLMSLVILDATVLVVLRDWPQAVAIVALLAPTMLLGKWVYST